MGDRYEREDGMPGRLSSLGHILEHRPSPCVAHRKHALIPAAACSIQRVGTTQCSSFMANSGSSQQCYVERALGVCISVYLVSPTLIVEGRTIVQNSNKMKTVVKNPLFATQYSGIFDNVHRSQ